MNTKKISAQELALFFRQMGTLMQSGIPLLTTCYSLQRMTKNKNIQPLLIQIKKTLLAGNALSDALKNKQYISQVTLQLLYMGEQTGKLDEMLLKIADQYEGEHALKNSIKQALFYPLIVLLIATILFAIMFGFIVPIFYDLFSDLKTPLPFFTQLIFSFSFIFRKLFLFFTISFLAILYFYHTLIRHFFQKISCHLPIIRTFLFRLSLTHFTHLLSVTLSAGLTLTEALKLIAMQTPSKELTQMIWRVRKEIYLGKTLYDALLKQSRIPEAMLALIKVGEQSGQLDNMLKKAAAMENEALNQRLQHALTLLEPLIMLLLGVLIGGVVLGMYLPIFNLGNAF